MPGVLMVALAVAMLVPQSGARAQQMPTIEVYKTPTCGCCNKWVEHLRNNGFTVRTVNLDRLADVKARHGVPSRVQSCHTGLIDGYVIEGHVPAVDIQRLLKERPSVPPGSRCQACPSVHPAWKCRPRHGHTTW